ncbi:nuclear mitotic apparatus protein 1 isoform X1 [Sarcophilus harrisii]|uniref:Nuclear mitotic apparatus protein 1 n=2 Tax=Sarcophilus harrisii TaxID=9305 RepID=A0A7N4V0A7_SARHA|nr:nuclear mitotic apparatus protein 1 isoform X1 [Sarcophilus harrisii]XP_031817872.1 nuclear mitotic apparatus protein 1 isoform X1 [Sarcophilus harrisii]XP_031817873.1 nuclear mitotic apparatus protein 1 isoform X1 [Sarcophilus harrisii]XP_031817875.1 nuclear mitotic apparatus protein 1 isoform X1 [Sarcophilus harrisii]XP_031817876.1 nuclear mitotic apparatus protein 1 isoform X1 [Sarcophilus harrisii]
MTLHETRAAALLSWVNSLQVAEPVTSVLELQDCNIFIQIINRIHGTEEGQQILQQPLLDRFNFISNFLQKNRKHQTSTESLVSVQKLEDGEELELAKVIMLLLYHSTMSSKSLRDWNQFDYKIQSELAAILKFVLDHEDGLSLNDNLKSFLQKAPLPSSSPSTSSDEFSPVPSQQAKKEVRFLELQKIGSSSGLNNFLSGSPASPMGDILQTPQFQMRRLKKQLADERASRDELELELTKSCQLLAEKDTQISMMQQRIDRLALLNEKQATGSMESKELEELRGKNESLSIRLHETLKQCQDLKTEKSQMERKIDQLSEENGDLSFKLRDFASHLLQLQEALNDQTEEHNSSTKEWREKQTYLETELDTTLQDKKCLEEKNEILQGKISQLEEQLAQIGKNPSQEKGEVLGDILQLEALKQEVATLAAKEAELQDTVKQMECERHQREAELQAERGRFEEEKQQLEQKAQAQEAQLAAQVASLHATLQQQDRDLADLKQRAEKEQTRLTETLQQQELASQSLKHQVEQLSSKLKQEEGKLQDWEVSSQMKDQQLAAAIEECKEAQQEKDAALKQLEELGKEKAIELGALQKQLQATKEACTNAQTCATQAEQEKNVMRQKVEELDACVVDLKAWQEEHKAEAKSAENLQTRVQELESCLKAEQQKVAEREELARENAQLQERLLSLEESVQNTKGILEDEKRRAAEALEGQLQRVSELEAETQSLARQREQDRRQLEEVKAGRRGLEAQLQKLGEGHQAKVEALHQELEKVAATQQEAERECKQMATEATSWRTRFEESQKEASQCDARHKEQLKALNEQCEGVQRQLQEAQERVAALEALVERQDTEQQEHTQLKANLAGALQQLQEKEEQANSLAEGLSRLQEEVAHLKAAAKKAEEEKETSLQKLAEEQQRAGELEAAAQQLKEQQGQELSRTGAALQAKEQEAEQLARELEQTRSALAKSRECQEEKHAQQEREVTRVGEERDQAKADLAAEKAAKAELERRLQSSLSEQRVEFATLQEALTQALEGAEGKEQQLKQLQKQENALRAERAELQRTLEELREQLVKAEEMVSQAGTPGATESGSQELEALRTQLGKAEQQCREQEEKISKLEHQLEASQMSQASQEGTATTLKAQLEESAQELAALQAAAQERSKAEAEWKAQVAHAQQEAERNTSLIGSLEEEVSILNLQVLEKEGESKELKKLVLAESEKSQKLEERLRLLQAETVSASTQAAERSAALSSEVQALREEAEKQRVSADGLRRELASQAERAEGLGQELKAWRERSSQKEQSLSSLQRELTAAQALVGELLPVKHLYQQLEAEQSALQSRHREELEQGEKAAAALQAELLRARRELGELAALRQKVAEQDRAAQQLRAENAGYVDQLSALQQAHSQLAKENRDLGERASHGRQQLEAELRRTQELEALRAKAEAQITQSQEEALDTVRQLETMTAKYENAKSKVLEERQRFQEERQKLTAQVEQLEVFQREQTKQVEELNKKLTQQQNLKSHESEIQQEAHLQAQLSELQALLNQKEQAAEHYKAQMERAKAHYDAKKQQNQELQERLQNMEILQKENTELRAESERLSWELQQSGLKTKEAEQTCRHLTAQVRTLEAQVAHADQQLRDLGKFQVATDALKSREPRVQPQLDLSTDSLELSNEEGTPLTSTRSAAHRTRKSSRTQPDGNSLPGELASPISQRLPSKVESLESLYFTPIPDRGQAPLDSSLDSLGDIILDSGPKTRSARRRTTQIIDITMLSRKLDTDEPDSSNSSFYSTQSAPAPQRSLRGGLRSASSAQSLANCPSRESRTRLGSMEDGNSALLSLPGYRPTTRSSARHSQTRASGGAPTGRSSFYTGTCQDEPEQLDDWNRIAELQQRNRVCLPHLKTCYPLEARPSMSLTTITDEEMKTGDPQETLRRASMQPAQTTEYSATHHIPPSITTRQHRKRVSTEPEQGLGTPEAKKPTSCFPRPLTPRDRHEGRKMSAPEGHKKGAPAANKQTNRRQSLAFNILNTPKRLGNSLLRGAAKKAAAKASPLTRSGTRRSPRIATTTTGSSTSPRARGKAKH